MLLLLSMLPKYCILFNALLLLPRRLYFHMPLFLGWFVSGITIQKAAMSKVQQSRNIVTFWKGNSLCFAVNPWSFLQATSLKRQHEDLTRPLVKPTTLSSCSSLLSPSARCCSCDFATTNMNSLKSHMRRHPQEHQAMQLLEQYRSESLHMHSLLICMIASMLLLWGENKEPKEVSHCKPLHSNALQWCQQPWEVDLWSSVRCLVGGESEWGWIFSP